MDKANKHTFRANDLFEDFRLLNSVSDPVVLFDTNLCVINLNDASITLLKPRFPKLEIGAYVKEIFPAYIYHHLSADFDAVIKNGIQRKTDFKLRNAFDTPLCFEQTLNAVFDSDNSTVSALMAVYRDITALTSEVEQLTRDRERLKLAIRGAKDGIWDWNLETDMVHLSPRWWDILGYEHFDDSEEQSVDEWFGRVYSEDLLPLRAKIAAHLEGRTSYFEDEHRMVHQDGSVRWVLNRGVCVKNGNNIAIRMAGSMTDITERKDIENQLHYNAYHDSLTGLPNRQTFMKLLEKCLNQVRRVSGAPYQFAVLFLDIDRFKMINDSLGHQAGDELIITIAQRLINVVRSGDLVARLGGDEFTVLLQNLDNPADATRIAKRIAMEIGHPMQIMRLSVQTSASIGIAYDNGKYTKPEELLRDADTAMYQAKSSPNNVYEVFDSSMHAQVLQQLQIETDLRFGIDQNQIEAWFHPCIDLSTRRVVGFEALARWHLPEGRILQPADFINIAEESGLVIELGNRILAQAAQFSARINIDRTDGDFYFISVNLSKRQLSHRNFVNTIEKTFREAGAPLKSLVLEIKEDVLMLQSAEVVETLKKLRALGVNLYLDDFGVGYSSIASLKKMPMNVIKIDRSFINAMSDGDSALQMVQAISTLAGGLNMGVIAEGIENIQQLENLKKVGCIWGQGFYFSKPLRLDEALKVTDYIYN